MSLSRSGTIINLVLAKDITTFIECPAFPTYCSNHRALVAVVGATTHVNDQTACLATGCLRSYYRCKRTAFILSVTMCVNTMLPPH